MCPNHPNHFVDQNLLQSCSASERLKLWDEFATQRIDQQAVKLEFIRKARCANPRFRMKVKLEDSAKVKVPALIKFYYANPPSIESVTHSRTPAIVYKKSSDSSNNNVTTRLDNNEESVINENSVEMKDDHPQEEMKSSQTDYCEAKDGVQLLSRSVLEVLAEQRIEEILNPDFRDYNSVDCKARVRAAVFSLTSKPLPAAFMVKNTLTIGTGPNSDLVLSNYGGCDFVSSKHAIIFYDEVISRVFGIFVIVKYF